MSIEKTLARIENRLEAVERLLQENADDVLDVDAVQRLTGLSKSAIYQKTCSRSGEPPELPHFKQGKRLYFRRSEIMQWLTQNRVKDRARITQDAAVYCAAHTITR
jgi:predicted DNA-binding transcriptional regulator AlpA